MLSYLSKTVSKAYKASKKALQPKQAYKETEQYKLIRSLEKFDSEILPTTKLSQLATMSYDLDKFQLIMDIMMLRLDLSNFDKESTKGLKQFRNCLIITSYLIKHGASGFIDQFRDQIQTLKNYEVLLAQLQTQESSTKKRYYLLENANRLKYVIELLEDKNKLIREKEISMLIKQKLKVAEKEKENNSMADNNDDENGQKSNKVDSFLDNYLWKYTGIIDGKLDQIAQVIADKFEKYLLEEVPENFEIDQVEIKEENRLRTETNFAENKIKEEKLFLEKKQNLKKQEAQENLLEL